MRLNTDLINSKAISKRVVTSPMNLLNSQSYVESFLLRPKNSKVIWNAFFTKTNEELFSHTFTDHPEVFTVEAMMPYLSQLSPNSAITKNLFLKDKKGGLYLLSAIHDKPVNLNEISKKVKAPNLRFASEETLYQTLKVKQGCVTAYALLNDSSSKVKFLLDQDVLQAQKVYFHPLVNNATTGISIQDFQKFVKLTNHDILSVQL